MLTPRVTEKKRPLHRTTRDTFCPPLSPAERHYAKRCEPLR